MIKISDSLKFKIIILLFLAGYFYLFFPDESRHGSPSVSVSSDGRYVLSTHRGQFLVLWDIKQRRSRLISKNASYYSNHFIEGTHLFTWQDVKTNTLFMQDIKLNTIKRFSPGFTVYSLFFSKNLNDYIASDKDWSIFSFKNGEKTQIKYGSKDYYYGKPIELSKANNLLLSSGTCGYKGDKLPISAGLTARDVNPKIKPHVNYSLMSCVTLWSSQTGKALYKLHGNASKTSATLSPDGKYVVAGDENSLAFVWDAQTGKRINSLYSLNFGQYIEAKGNQRGYFEEKNVIPQPKDFCWKPNRFYRDCIYSGAIFAMRFINNDQYFRFTYMVPYAILYNVTEPDHKKYLKLEGHPDVYGYSSAKSVATAPTAEILVMATNIANGIRVYKYNRKQQTLKLIWAPDEFETTRWQKFTWFWWPRFKKALTW